MTTLHKIVQITDTHLKGKPEDLAAGVNPYLNLKTILQRLKQDKPDLITLTGDIADEGLPSAYHLINQLIEEVGIPVHAVGGNHDNPQNMKRYLQSNLITLNKSFTLNDWQFILLETAIEGEDFGIVKRSELKFLNYVLENTKAKNIIVMMHHAPVEVGSLFIDKLKVLNNFDFLEVVEASNIKYVFFGHVHQEFMSQIDHVKFFACPSACVQFRPNSDKLILDRDRIGFRWIFLRDDLLETVVEWIKV